jgi:hypothetical protein
MMINYVKRIPQHNRIYNSLIKIINGISDSKERNER